MTQEHSTVSRRLDNLSRLERRNVSPSGRAMHMRSRSPLHRGTGQRRPGVGGQSAPLPYNRGMGEQRLAAHNSEASMAMWQKIDQLTAAAEACPVEPYPVEPCPVEPFLEAAYLPCWETGFQREAYGCERRTAGLGLLEAGPGGRIGGMPGGAIPGGGIPGGAPGRIPCQVRYQLTDGRGCGAVVHCVGGETKSKSVEGRRVLVRLVVVGLK